MNSFTEKHFLLFLIICISILSKTATAQTISYFEDTTNTETFNSIKSLEFTPYVKTINAGVNLSSYWLKIEDFTEPKHNIQITNAHITKAEAIQGHNYIPTKNNERFITYETNNLETVYIKVYTNRESFIPIKVLTKSAFDYKEKKLYLLMGIYYGFTIMILLLNLFYYFNFKDVTFLYYFFFLFSVSFGLMISDGILKLIGLSSFTIDFIESTDHFLVAVSGVLFATLFLQMDYYYPKLKYVGLVLVVIIGILSTCYLSSLNFNYYVVLELLVFLIFIIYVVAAGCLFNKNDFSKIFLLAYFFILILGICYYINKLIGITLFNISASVLKIGGFIEMLVLSFAVVYRMKTLKVENDSIRLAIDSYITEIKELSATVDKQANGNTTRKNTEKLSFRENEILQLISVGKTNKEIAMDLHISENTVKYHIKNIYTKLNIKSRKEVPAVINNMDKLH